MGKLVGEWGPAAPFSSPDTTAGQGSHSLDKNSSEVRCAIVVMRDFIGSS